MKSAEKMWDVIVIGGGPAGMMAAGRAAENGAKVLLLEKNPSLGKKLLITGGGRCNVTNAEADTKVLLGKFKDGGKFLASPFSRWSSEQSIRFFNTAGMPTKVEPEKRVFPVSDSAQSVHDVLTAYMKAGKVTIRTKSPVRELVTDSSGIRSVKVGSDEYRAHAFVLATGGKSRPETGSTGEGFEWLKALGHRVEDTRAALVPIRVKEKWVQQLAGVALKDVKVTSIQNGAKQESRVGKILFTHVGLSGPAILNMSRDIGELLSYGEVSLEIDLFPKDGYDIVQAKLQELLKKNHVKKIKNSLRELIPTALVPVVLELAHVDGETFCNSVTRESRNALMKLVKGIPLSVMNLLGLEKAVVTSGGVSLEEVDFKSFISRRFPNLFLVGDVLDIDRPSGGYSLQLCWTTGQIAGESAASAAMKL